jgi:anti-sigma regulatory factor (Ser/Thr protein kinase)
MEDLSLHILDIAENSVTAGATLIQIRLVERRAENSFFVEIEDNGKGIAEDLVDKALDPFFTSRTTRSVGLGLSLLSQSARETGGDIVIKSASGRGTTVTAQFRPAHIDMKPLGDITETLMVLIAGNPEIDFTFTYDYDKGKQPFAFDTREIRADLENIPINAPEVLTVLRRNLSRFLTDIKNKVV